jgi:Flp pilus assembly protein TadG
MLNATNVIGKPMKKLCIIGKNMRKLWSCERGAVAPLVGFCAIMLVGAVAVAVDVGRGQVAQSKLQAALDSAGLAAGAVVSQNLTEAALEAEGQKYLNSNFAGKTIDATITEFTLDLSEDEMLVTLEAHASLPTTFMRIFGHDTMEVAARTEITREMTGLEVALVLDVTGSMCDPCSKRDAMKQGAHDLMGIMFGSNATVDDLWIGIVPFSQGVNIGTDRTDWLSDYDTRMAQDNCVGWNHSNWPHSHVDGESTTGYICPTNGPNVSTRTYPLTLVNDWMVADDPVPPTVKNGSWTGTLTPWYFKPHAWSGCVEARETDDEDVTDTTPVDAKFPLYFAPDSSSVNDWRGSAGSRQVTASRSANKYCPEDAITPLTNVRATLDAAIDALDVQGYTQLPLGASWGWRLLSPKWRGVWGGVMDSNNLPLDYDEELSNKVVIFMTDGNNDMPSNATYTAYGSLSQGRLGTTDEATAELEMDTRFTEICNAMKGTEDENPDDETTGITIYTISFGTDVTPESKALLKACASVGDYFFDAPTEDELKLVFKAIGDALSKLRVSK